MKRIEVLSHVTEKLEVVRENFNQELFSSLAPPFVPMQVLRFDGITKGSIFEIDMIGGLLPKGFLDKLPVKIPFKLGSTWKGEVVDAGETQDGFFFIDEALELPFPLSKWRHLHRILPNPQQGGTDILDQIEFSCVHPLLEIPAYSALLPLFVYRKKSYQDYFNRMV